MDLQERLNQITMENQGMFIKISKEICISNQNQLLINYIFEYLNTVLINPLSFTLLRAIKSYLSLL